VQERLNLNFSINVEKNDFDKSIRELLNEQLENDKTLGDTGIESFCDDWGMIYDVNGNRRVVNESG